MQPLLNTALAAWRRASRLACWLLLPLLLLAAPARAENVYIMDLRLNGIYSVDIVSGGPATLLTPINPPNNPQGYTLATRPSDGMLFYLDSSGTNPNLWRWNPATPTAPPVLVGTPGASTTDVVRLGFDSADNLIAMDTTTNMWTLDTSTGGILTQTPLSGDRPTSSGDLCLNTTTGVLYMVANQQVFTVTSSGASTLLGSVTGLGVTGVNGYVTGCAFTRDGTMLISLYQGGNLRRVNLGTLAATALPTSTGMANIGDLSTAPQRSADLRLSKTASNTTPGATTSFTVTVTNDGPAAAYDVRVLDAVPAGLVVTSFTSSQGTYSTATVTTTAGTFPAGTWRLGGLAVGASATLTMDVNVTGAAAVTNTAQISYSDQYDPDSVPANGVGTEDDQASVVVTPSPDLTVDKTANGSFTVGLNGSYSIRVNNEGSAATTGSYSVVDVLPATLTYVSAAGTGWTCSYAAGTRTVTCNSSTAIAARSSNANTITLTVTPAAGAAPTVTNTASVSGGGEPASNNGNNSGTDSNLVCLTNCPDLRPNKSLSVSSLTVGSTATYTVSVTNVGGTTTGAATYTLSDPLPTGLTLYSVPVAGAGWSCPASAPNNVVGGTGVSCTRSTALLAGATSTTVTFVVNVLNTAVPQVVNTASVSGGGEPPSANGNNTASVTSSVSDFDLAIRKAAGTLAVGSTSTYTFTVSNVGTRTTTGTISFTDDLPAGLTIRSLTPTNWTIGAGWTCAANGDQPGANTAGNSHIYCTRSTAIAPGANAPTVVVPVTVAAAAAPSVTNTVDVAGSTEAPALTGNNSFSVTTPVSAPDLAVTKSHNGSFAVGVSEQYTVTVTNIGQMTTTGTVTVVDTLPAGLTYVSAAGIGWTCGFASPNVTCTRATAIADNTSAPPIVITVTPTAAAAAASPVVNNVVVSGGNEPAGNNGNNSASDSTVVSYPPVLAKAFSPASIPAGGTSTLTLTVTNPAGGSGAITGVAITDPFPAGLVVANPPSIVNTCGFTVNSGNLQGDTLLDVSGGVTGGPGTSCLISVRVTASGVGSLVNTTGAVRSANAGTGNTATATLTTTSPGTPVLTKVTTPNPVGVGENAILTFTITNKATTTNDMGFRDTMPAGLVVAPSGAFGGTCTSTTGTALGRVGAPGTSTLTITGVDLAGNASCTVTIPVRSTVAGTYTNTTANISNLLGGLSAANVNDVLVVEAVGLSKTFSPSSIVAGTTSTMALVLTNGPGLAEQNNIAFTENLPGGVVLASVPAASQCGGTVTGTSGGSTVAVSGATLAAGLQACTITAVVTAAASGTYNNAAANITGLSINLVNNVTATLTVTPPPGPNLVKTNGVASISPGDTTTYVITMSNTSGATYTGGTAAVLRDPAVANLTINSAACAAQGGAVCPALASAAMISALQSAGGMTVSSMPNNSTIVLTVTATLSGNPTGTLTNVATATSNGGVTTVQDSDTIVYPSLTSTKTVAVERDPINGTTNPKNIPGSENRYTITVANSGAGRVDDGSVAIVDRIPPNTALFVNSLGGSPAGPVTFTDAASSLTLTYTALNSTTDDVDFSSDGGTTWTYVPTPDGSGYDAAVTHLRVRPRGRMAGWSGAGPYPAFSLDFKVRLN